MAFSFFINTGLIPIITGADFSKLTELIFGTNSTIYYQIHLVGATQAADIDNFWYTLVGYQILSNLFINAVVPNISALLNVFINNTQGFCQKNCPCCRPSTQAELNEI